MAPAVGAPPLKPDVAPAPVPAVDEEAFGVAALFMLVGPGEPDVPAVFVAVPPGAAPAGAPPPPPGATVLAPPVVPPLIIVPGAALPVRGRDAPVLYVPDVAVLGFLWFAIA